LAIAFPSSVAIRDGGEALIGVIEVKESSGRDKVQ
jgi:hypothetical protein